MKALLSILLLLHAPSFAEDESHDVQTPQEIERARKRIAELFPDRHARDRNKILLKYDHLDPGKVIPSDLLEDAIVFFETNRGGFENQSYFSIVNFKAKSDIARFYLVNLVDGSVKRYHTTHGKFSDPDHDGKATQFGNVIGSGMSSLGFVKVGEEYWGDYGRSLRLDGLSTTNSNLRARSVVLHPWNLVKEKNVKQIRSLGCIAFDPKVSDAIIDKVTNGSFMYFGFTAL